MQKKQLKKNTRGQRENTIQKTCNRSFGVGAAERGGHAEPRGVVFKKKKENQFPPKEGSRHGGTKKKTQNRREKK